MFMKSVFPAFDSGRDTVTNRDRRDTTELIDHILNYHQTYRSTLPELVVLARKVETVHGDDPAAPHGLADMLEKMWDKMQVHMKEELTIFPALSRQADGLATPTTQMRHEHDDYISQLRQLERITRGFNPPDGACRPWFKLLAGVYSLVDDLEDHIRLENDLLLPRLEGGSR